MKKENLIRIIITSCTLVLLIMTLFSCGHGFTEYYNKPTSEVPAWFWLLFT